MRRLGEEAPGATSTNRRICAWRFATGFLAKAQRNPKWTLSRINALFNLSSPRSGGVGPLSLHPIIPLNSGKDRLR